MPSPYGQASTLNQNHYGLLADCSQYGCSDRKGKVKYDKFLINFYS